MKRAALALFVPFLWIFTVACTSYPQLKRWEGKKMTLCCAYCAEPDWQKTVQHHCPAGAQHVGGENLERVTGYETTHRKDWNDQEIAETHAQTYNEECRVYSCRGPIDPGPYSE